jgi:hypothetical protein
VLQRRPWHPSPSPRLRVKDPKRPPSVKLGSVRACSAHPLYRRLCCKTQLVSISAPDFGFLRVLLSEFPLCELLTLSTLDGAAMRDRPVPELAGRGREAWLAASGFAQLLSVALRL